MKKDQYRRPENNSNFIAMARTCSMCVLAGLAGCRGTPLTFPTALNGLKAPARVPAPATGSFQIPGSYSSGNGAASTPNGGLGSSSFSPGVNSTSMNGMRTNPASLPVSNFVNGVTTAQSQFRNATNNALNAVNRTADTVNSRVEQASARVDRLGEGVVQASAILNDAAYAPVNTQQMEQQLPPISSLGASNNQPATGRIGDSPSADNGNWRTPGQK